MLNPRELVCVRVFLPPPRFTRQNTAPRCAPGVADRHARRGVLRAPSGCLRGPREAACADDATWAGIGRSRRWTASAAATRLTSAGPDSVSLARQRHCGSPLWGTPRTVHVRRRCDRTPVLPFHSCVPAVLRRLRLSCSLARQRRSGCDSRRRRRRARTRGALVRQQRGGGK